MVNQNHIKIFGLGLALILLCGALLNHLHMHLGVIRTVLIFGSILFVIDKSLKWPWLYALMYAFLGALSVFVFLKHAPSMGVMLADALSVLFLAVVLIKWEALVPLYQLWMKLAHFIGLTVTATILASVYFFLFTPVRILLRLFGKDHLDRAWGIDKPSYWKKKEQVSFSQKKYQQQF